MPTVTPQPFPTPSYPEFETSTKSDPKNLQTLWYPYYPAPRSRPQLQGAKIGNQGERWDEKESIISGAKIPDNSFPYGGPRLVGLHPSSNGRWMIVDVTHWTPQLIDLQTNSVSTVVSDIVSDDWGFVAWHPDGQYLLIRSTEGYQLVDLESQKSSVVSFPSSHQDGANIIAAAYSPDGTMLADITIYAPVYGGRDTWLLEVGIQGNKEARRSISQLENAGAIRYQSLQWSPDGTKLVFIPTIQDTPQGDELWILDVSTNELHSLLELTKSGCYTTPAVWSPDGKFLAAIKVNCKDDGSIDSNIFFIDPDTGHNEQVTQLKDQLISNLFWAPDSKLLAFNITIGEYSEVWVTNLDNSQQYPVSGPVSTNTPFIWLP
jgi:Tol biopolymer transport system component